MTTSRQVKLDAVAELCRLGGFSQADPQLVASRSRSLLVAQRRALRLHHDDPAAIDRIWRLYDVARGRADALDDAIHDLTDLDEPDRPQVPTLAQLDDALETLKENVT